jgi:hypothetical protein
MPFASSSRTARAGPPSSMRRPARAPSSSRRASAQARRRGLPRGHGRRGARQRADSLLDGQPRGHRRDDGLRDGHRQGRCPHDRPRGAARGAWRGITRRSAAPGVTAPSSAVLMHSFVDRKIHEFFHERDYPDPPSSWRMSTPCSPSGPSPRAPSEKERARSRRLREGPGEARHSRRRDRVDGRRGHARRRPRLAGPYVVQREHKLLQLQVIARFAVSHGCRMVHLVRHFGDQEDSGEPCGICDVCAPDAASRPPSASPERQPSISSDLERILAALSRERRPGDWQAPPRDLPGIGDAGSPLLRAPARRPGARGHS